MGERPRRDTILAPFSRVSSTGHFIAEIDGLRFVAIMAVVFYHLNDYTVRKLALAARHDPLSSFFRKGDFGVPLFFVISGFIISYPFAKRLFDGKRGVPLRPYFLRRMTRLEPPYLINLLLLFALLVMIKGADGQNLFSHLWVSSVYFHNLVFGEPSLVNHVAWSLEVEFQFYVLAPLLVAVFRIPGATPRRLLLITLIVIAPIASDPLIAALPRLKLSLVNYVSYFLAGFLLADFYLVSWKEGNISRQLVWDLFSIGCWIAIPFVLLPNRSLHVLLPLTVVGAYVGAFRGPLLGRVFRNPFVFTIGGMCYTIYLYHFLAISLFGRFLIDKVWLANLSIPFILAVMSAVVIPPAIAICAVLFLLTEKPFMRRDWHLTARARLLGTSGFKSSADVIGDQRDTMSDTGD